MRGTKKIQKVAIKESTSPKEAPQKSGVLSFLMHDNIGASSLQRSLEGVIIALLILAVYLFTTNPLTRPFAPQLFVACFAFLAVGFFLEWKMEHSITKELKSRTVKIVIFGLVTATLLWVGNTGWFLSPFFYLLYLVGLSLGFLFSTSAALTFTLVLIGILLPNIGSIDSQIDIVSLLSLVLIIPLSYFLRREYLRRVEREKKILILEQEHKAFQSKLEEVLSNKVTKIAVDLREPLNDVRSLALYMKKNDGKRKKETLDRVVMSSEKALEVLKEFEQDTTGKMLIRSPH